MPFKGKSHGIPVEHDLQPKHHRADEQSGAAGSASDQLRITYPIGAPIMLNPSYPRIPGPDSGRTPVGWRLFREPRRLQSAQGPPDRTELVPSCLALQFA
jgi:hypothetical protein